MIDELAKAICFEECPEMIWDKSPEYSKERYRNLARAVLTRLMEPTPGMVEACMAEIKKPRMHVSHAASDKAAEMTIGYCAMLRAAMEE